MLLGNGSHVTGKSVNFHLNGATSVQKKNIWVELLINLPNRSLQRPNGLVCKWVYFI